MQKKIHAATPALLTEAIDSTKYLICDMRTLKDSIENPIVNAWYFQNGNEYIPMLQILIKYEAGDIILVSPAACIQKDSNWLYEHTKRNIYYVEADAPILPENFIDKDQINTISSGHLAEIADSIRHLEMIDVRSTKMYESIRISGSQNIPLVNAWSYINVLDHKRTLYIYGNDDGSALSLIYLLRYYGYRNMVLVVGGFAAIQRSGRFFITGNSNPV